MNQTIQERIHKIREIMKMEKVDFYLVPTSDFHNSEYVNEYFKVREFLSGFTGSNGTLVIQEKEAGLWTDGRYFIQAEKELTGTGIILFRIGEEGVPTIVEYLKTQMKQGQVLGFDGRVVDAAFGKKLESQLKEFGVTVSYDKDLVAKMWENRPQLPAGKITILSTELTGFSMAEKLEQVKSELKEQESKALLLSKLDDLMWLFNIRGCDVECNPVALSYAFIAPESTYLFLQKEALTEELKTYLNDNEVQIKDYHEIVSFLKEYQCDGKISVNEKNVNYTLYKAISEKNRLLEKESPTELLKAKKNDVERKNMEAVYRKDSVAVVKFIYWLKNNIGKIPMNEKTAANYLDNLRKNIDGYLDLSFPTISAYKENAAMCHYETTDESNKELEAEGLYLVDSGGQYLGGTTDVTRTVALGPVTEEMKQHFTLVACGMLQLTYTKFLYGCSGRNIDIMARQPLWDCDIDFKHGTGHGIGYILNVHEGPQNIRWQYVENLLETIFEEGMVVSNEPGIYIEGSHGIRIENIMIAKNGIKNEYGQFMHFDTLTFVPIDKDVLDTKYMTQKDFERLNQYHREVYDQIAPFLNEKEQEWLKQVTTPLQV